MKMPKQYAEEIKAALTRKDRPPMEVLEDMITQIQVDAYTEILMRRGEEHGKRK